ncbi:MAG: hypothetical protein KDC12_14290, partial [Flavobacteriales bacterium]|nr:hypothetical protein [Flavobacteriales bacterium]
MRRSIPSFKSFGTALSAFILVGSFIEAEAYHGSTAFENMIPGCTNLEACNYNPDATSDDGSCLFWDECGECGGTNESGCTDPQAVNYDASANCNSGTCAYCAEMGTSFDPIFFDNYLVSWDNEWVVQVFACENTISNPNFGLLL